MKTLSIINMKGGVGKTTTAINVAHVLATRHSARVLLVDMDKQGNTSKFFGLYSHEWPSVADVLTMKDCDVAEVVRQTAFEGLHIIPANMRLLAANREVLMDVSAPQQTRLKRALNSISGQYDVCIIDNAPDLNMGTINALVASDAVIVPLCIDKFAFDGLGELVEQVEGLRGFNPALHIAGGVVTMYRRDKVNAVGLDVLRRSAPIRIYKTVIRATVRVTETTYAGKPLLEYAPRSTAAQDYEALVDEILHNGAGCAACKNGPYKKGM